MVVLPKELPDRTAKYAKDFEKRRQFATYHQKDSDSESDDEVPNLAPPPPPVEMEVNDAMREAIRQIVQNTTAANTAAARPFKSATTPNHPKENGTGTTQVWKLMRMQRLHLG